VALGTFELSQPFGCVPQLLGYYPVISGCPATRPSFHNGLDFAARQGTPIYAVASGWVTVAGRDGTSTVANTRIVVQHDGASEGYATEYYHWIRSYVEPGDYVRAGELIAEVGSVGYSTGPHLHFSVVEYETNQRIDPMGWLPAIGSGGSYADAGSEASSDRTQNSNAGGGIIVTDYIDPTPLPVRTAP
jgi:murein DD-endopeptidase MepM/ murein hydrolase activator NlpD